MASIRNLRIPLLLLTALTLQLSCVNKTAPPHTANEVNATASSLDDYLRTDFQPADGFDFPFGNADGRGPYQDLATGKQHSGWYVATNFAETYDLGIHPGEDWNGNGGGNTDLGQNVFAVANGRVVSAAHHGRLWGNVIVIEHLVYENHGKRKVRSVYAHLNEIKVVAGAAVERRQLIGTIGQDPDKLFNAHLHLELRWDESLEPTYWPKGRGLGKRTLRRTIRVY